VDFRLNSKRDVAAAKRSFARQSKARDRPRGPLHWTVTRHRTAPCAR
jgi:hypothetical protein